MKFNFNIHLIAALFLATFYYSLFYSNLVYKAPIEEFPSLRDRLGTILWHSTGTEKNAHVYCYYPTSKENYKNKGGEYIIKRADSINDCEGWLGAALFNEPKWVSEREKIWWNKEMLEQDALANQKNSQEIN